MKFYRALVSSFILSIVFLLTTCAEKPTEVTTLGSIYGIVNDESNNNPLSGVTVSIPEIGNRVTSTNGAYEFDELEEDVYSVTASKAGYVSVTEQVEAVSNKNKEVNFYLRIAQPAQLLVSPQSLNFGQTETSLQLTIDNGGDDELSWQVSSDQSWLTSFPTTGTTTSETDEITVSVNRGLLSVGDYNANLSFTSNGGDLTVPVSMEVTPVGLIVSTNALDFGEIESEISFTISNSGSGELNWSISTSDSWITASPTSGMITTNSEDVAVSIERSNLTAGTYDGSITIDSNGGNQTISVSMVVPDFPAPTLEEPYNITENSMTLAWSVISHEDFQEYRLYKSTSSGVSENSTLVTSSTNPYENTYNDSGLDDGTTYYYRVYSLNNYGIAVGSNEVSATTIMEIGDWGLVNTFSSDVNMTSIYAFSDENVWVAGSKNGNSIIYHYTGGSWIEISPPNIGELNDIEFSSENDGWAVSNDGIIHYNGGSWSVYNSEITHILDIDVNGYNDVWFATYGESTNYGASTLYHLDGSNINQYAFSWACLAVDVKDDNTGIVLTGGDYNDDSKIFTFNGFSWVEDYEASYRWNTGAVQALDENNMFSTNSSLTYSIYAFSSTQVWVSGCCDGGNGMEYGVQFLYLDNGEWASSPYTGWWSGGTYFWDGESLTLVFDYSLYDMHFFELQTGWGCAGNNVYRYN